MKDLYAVLRQKELDIVRVRREMQALLTVIPLLADDLPASEPASKPASKEEDERNLLGMVSAQRAAEPSANDMADLETYYPFVRHMRQPGG
jgi:hypothetical protein